MRFHSGSAGSGRDVVLPITDTIPALKSKPAAGTAAGPAGARARKGGRSAVAGFIGAAAGAMTLAHGAAARAAVPPPADLFPVGVFLQPVETFDAWKSRGVNTVVDFWPGQQPLEVWNAAAVQRGLYMVRAPRANLADDKNEKYLLAWSHADEPDLHGVAPEKLAFDYAAMKKADPARPVYVNFSGANVIYPNDSLNQPQYGAWMKSADWVANDVYPLTAYNTPDWIDLKAPLKGPINQRWNPGAAVDQLREWSGGKKQFAYIETSFQNLDSGPAAGARGVTPDELRGQVWDAVIHGAKGIVYFPQKLSPFEHDATPADVAAEITRQDALLNSLGAVLNSASDDTANPVTLTGASTSADAGALEASWRTYHGHRYFFVLNFSHTASNDQTLTLPGVGGLTPVSVFGESRTLLAHDGTFTDSFAPYALHVYTDAGGLSLSPKTAVPEPAGAGMVLGALAAASRRPRRKAA